MKEIDGSTFDMGDNFKYKGKTYRAVFNSLERGFAKAYPVENGKSMDMSKPPIKVFVNYNTNKMNKPTKEK